MTTPALMLTDGHDEYGLANTFWTATKRPGVINPTDPRAPHDVSTYSRHIG